MNKLTIRLSVCLSVYSRVDAMTLGDIVVQGLSEYSISTLTFTHIRLSAAVYSEHIKFTLRKRSAVVDELYISVSGGRTFLVGNCAC